MRGTSDTSSREHATGGLRTGLGASHRPVDALCVNGGDAVEVRSDRTGGRQGVAREPGPTTAWRVLMRRPLRRERRALVMGIRTRGPRNRCPFHALDAQSAATVLHGVPREGRRQQGRPRLVGPAPLRRPKASVSSRLEICANAGARAG